MRANGQGELNDLEALRRFLEQDDGREFLMVNLIKVAPEAVDPKTGRTARGRDLMLRYARVFMPTLIARGGVPAFTGRKVGPYVDAWNVPEDPAWSLFGLMRYRSRRDMMSLAADPRFNAAHEWKKAALDASFAFPAAPMGPGFAGPRTTVFLILALAAALIHLAGLTVAAGLWASAEAGLAALIG